jgi:Xaa-Pro aminopeptidase
LVESLREVKEAKELAQIRKALRIHKQAHQFLKSVIRPKISEKDVLLKLTNFVLSKGVGFSFDPIVASGPNSCYPHAKVTNRKICSNEPVLIDMGIDVGGYKSDLTRMFFLGKISNLVRHVNDHVNEAQKRAIRKIQAGVSIAKVDFEARNYLESHKLAKYFGHALGHGVGLEIHEDPRLAQNNSAVLREGAVITVEPAVYMPNKFGIRIEDMVLVTKKGCQILSDNIN